MKYNIYHGKESCLIIIKLESGVLFGNTKTLILVDIMMKKESNKVFGKNCLRIIGSKNVKIY